MRKLLAMLLTGIVFFMMSGCGSNDDDDHHEGDIITTVPISNLSQGYTIVYYNSIATLTVDYCGNTATQTLEMLGEAKSQTGSFEGYDDQVLFSNFGLGSSDNTFTVGTVVTALWYETETRWDMTVGSIDKIQCGGGEDHPH